MKRLRRAISWLVILAALGGGGAWLYRVRQVQAKADLPVAAARKGTFEVIVRCRGDLVAMRSVQLPAPYNIPGLQIVWLAPANTEVSKGDPVIRFDSSAARGQLAEREAELLQAQATLEQTVAQGRMTAEQDGLDLASARVEVERARLEVSKQEIVSRLQGEQSKIDFGLAEDKQRVQQATVELHQKSATSKIASITRQLEKAKADIELTTRRLANMEILAPANGVVIYSNNFSQGWMNAKPFKVGDNVWAGSIIAELPDLSSLHMKGKIEEIDRGRIGIGQEARILIDTFPEKPFAGKLAGISPLVEQSFGEWPPTRNFKALGSFNDPDKRLRPGMNGRLDIIVERIPNAISIPANAVFPRKGRPTVYIADETGWRPQEVEVLARNPDEVAIRGIEPGTKVALVEPGVDPRAEKK